MTGAAEIGKYCKNNVVHFRPKSISRTNTVFTFGNGSIQTVDQYTYLGVVLSEHLDYDIVTKAVAQSASRALGLLIAKCRTMGGVPYDVFTKLYDSVVWPVVNYSAQVWGFRSFSCIDAVQNRAMMFYLGVGKYTPNDAIVGDMGWNPTIACQWKSICLYWSKLSNLDNIRTNKRIASWCASKANRSCKNCFYLVSNFLRTNELSQYSNINTSIGSSQLVNVVVDKVLAVCVNKWTRRIT